MPMKNLKRTFLTLLMIFICTAMTLSFSCATAQAKSKKVSLTKKVTMTVGKKKKIPLKNNKKKVKWTSNNKKVVKITKGTKKNVTVKALKKGTAKVTAKIGKKKYTCKVTVKKASAVSPSSDTPAPGSSVIPENYTYTVTPLLAPFNEYFYVKTDNPDPSSFRFVDKESKYDSSANTAPCSISPTTGRYLDVSYENKATGRVPGGYIFVQDAFDMDGGKLTLQKKTTTKNGLEYVDTSITVNCPPVKSYLQYLIDTFTKTSNTLFENLDAVQTALNNLALYPRPVRDTNKPSAETPYPLLASSPYPEISLNEWYAMYNYADEGLFLDSLYPYVLNSTAFPSAMYNIARMLDSSCTVAWGSTHSKINVTKNGVTKVYGGAGTGGTDPLYTKHIENLFLFNGSSADYATHGTLQNLMDKRKSYGELAAADASFYRNQIQGDLFKNTVSPGSWLRVAVEGYTDFSHKAYAYVTQGIQFQDDTQNIFLTVQKDVWIDGRYINECHTFEKGAVFKDHPKADIIIRNMSYTDMKGVARRGDVLFKYEEASGTWKSNAYTFGYLFGATDLEIPDEFILTQAEVAALGVDKNTNTDPASGFIYDGSAAPGTPF